MKWKVLLVGVLLLILTSPTMADGAFEPIASTTSTITQGETKFFSHPVALGSTEMNIRLTWTLPPDYNSLALQIFSPNGLPITEFTDPYENPTPNGIIPVKVLIPKNTPAGDWVFSVIGQDVSDIQTFTLQGEVVYAEGERVQAPPAGETMIHTARYVDRGIFSPDFTAQMSVWFTYDKTNAPKAHIVDISGISHDGKYLYNEYMIIDENNTNGETTVRGIITARKISEMNEKEIYVLEISCTKDGEVFSNQMKMR